MSAARIRDLASSWACRLKNLWRVLAVLHFGVIFWSSGRSWDQDLPKVALGMSNFLHFPLYAGLATWIHLSRSRPQGERVCAWLTVLLTAGLGLGDEIHQSFVPGRDFSLLDVATDTFAACFAVVLVDTICSGPKIWPRWRLHLALTILAAVTSSFVLPRIWPDL